MDKLIAECHDFFKDCGFDYAVCGGYALELFSNKKVRTHSDVDLSIFSEDKKTFYHKVKNQIDFDSVIPLLPKTSKDWLITALETAYPEGNKRLDRLKTY